ncbi:hypothetical protein SKAU_G00269260 [Synaphobranchus kaupii]|uniref:Uncharacterized protein n=1 Tax=Synaphobranchus kaupii TaxID=118154 RepID=A0A9Q1EZX8_SYNKA|nr:hypothetical protein SKAU_G00269260 [Synaphobranchus kaupii]
MEAFGGKLRPRPFARRDSEPPWRGRGWAEPGGSFRKVPPRSVSVHCGGLQDGERVEDRHVKPNAGLHVCVLHWFYTQSEGGPHLQDCSVSLLLEEGLEEFLRGDSVRRGTAARRCWW